MTLEKVCKKLLIHDPFWGLFLLGLNKVPTHKVRTMAVAPNGIGVDLLVNEDFWNSLSDTEQPALLLHELHHLAFDHIFMGKDFPDKDRFNVAADLEVNCYIEGLPPNDGHPDVKMFGLPENQGTKWYYDNLPPAGRWAGFGFGSLTDDHSTWKEFDIQSPAVQELMQNQINTMLVEAAKQTEKQQGKVPGCLTEKIARLQKVQPRVYDWKSHFRRVLGTEIEVKLKKTYQRSSKRFPNSPGVRFMKRVAILVGVDTSGSVSQKELVEFFCEIEHIRRTGARVHVIECDTKIHKEWDYTGKQDIVITGRGGTKFDPMIEYYRKHKKEYTCFVLFTDGGADVDHLNVPNNDMLWLISSRGEQKRYPGKAIYMPKRNDTDQN